MGRPFLILRKYNGFGEETKSQKKKDNTLKKGGCPLKSDFLTEVVTYFKSKYH